MRFPAQTDLGGILGEARLPPHVRARFFFLLLLLLFFFLDCAFTPPRINGATHGNEPGFVTVAAPVQCPYVLECFASHSGTGRLRFWTRLSRCLCDAPDELSKHPWKNFCGLPSPQRTPYRSRSQSLAPRALPWTPRATERLPNCPEL